MQIGQGGRAGGWKGRVLSTQRQGTSGKTHQEDQKGNGWGKEKEKEKHTAWSHSEV